MTGFEPAEAPAELLYGFIPKQYGRQLFPIGVVALAVLCAAPGKVISSILHLVLTSIGVAIGVGLGLGLAMHVYEQLHQWNTSHKEQTTTPMRPDLIRPKSNVRQPSNLLEDGTAYVSLMASAGYNMDDKVLRGQVLRASEWWALQYPFTQIEVQKQKAPQLLQQDWPSLPSPVAIQLGRFVEHIMRDYISGWYKKMDQSIEHRDEKEKRKEGIKRDSVGESEPLDKEKEDDDTHTAQKKKMVFRTNIHRRVPFVDNTYKVMSAVFGNLATRVEHVNLFSLALLKWTHVLGHTFKVYRTLRKHAVDKIDGRDPSEVEVAREFLLAGKLHRAVTFGLDVPSLLFADAAGEYGTGTDQPPKDDTQVLEQRLFHTTMLKDCELDYNRVLAHRLVRALLPRAEFGSSGVSSLVVEILAGCVLQPLMGIFTPNYLNGWIISGIRSTEKKDGGETAQASQEEVEKVLSEVEKHQASAVPGASNDETDTVPDQARRVSQRSLVDPARKVTEPTFNPTLSVSQDISLGVSEVAEGMAKVASYVAEEDHSGLRTVAMDVVETPVVLAHTVDQMVANPTEVGAIEDDGLLDDTLEEFSTGDDGEFDDEEVDLEDESLPAISDPWGDNVLNITAMTLIQLHKFVHFENCRQARMNNHEADVNWDDPKCQSAVLRLVLVVEAALLHGRCQYRGPSSTTSEAGSNESFGEDYESTFSEVLMDMTSDIDAFEERVDKISKHGQASKDIDYDYIGVNESINAEMATLRTLISTWLHTGQLYRSIEVIIKAHGSLLSHFYAPHAFLAVPKNADVFAQRMKALDGVDIMVDTMAVLASPRLDPDAESPSLSTPFRRTGGVIESPNAQSARSRLGLLASSFAGRSMGSMDDQGVQTTDLAAYNVGNMSLPRYLDFERNSAFASSLRTERDRRMQSWESRKADDSIQYVHHKGASDSDKELHQELHNLARIFYNGTNVMAVRDAARRDETADAQAKVSLLTVEMASNRRRIEVPDDDSSFLLRAQPRPLNPVSVHRDDRNHDLSYKCFLATYEEPAIPAGSNRYNGGRFIRRTLLQFYPIDRTAAIMLHNDQRKLDKRKGSPLLPETVASHSSTPYLSGAFLRERHLCQKWTPKGVSTQSFLSSNVMELTDFNATPRSGKALDFIYRMSLFERPTVDLAGKRFTVHDSAGRGPHRADASALEVSDAALSALLLTIGRDWEAPVSEGEGSSKPAEDLQNSNERRHRVEMGPDGYPMIFMKFNQKQGDKNSVEIKPFRLSFVRAALMVTSARQEAQLQCLVDCVKAGSAKSATKARTEAQLRPTLKILEFANDQSVDKVKASSLLRDLKIGIYHIDREQLRRNGLLNPRNPTIIRKLSTRVEGAFQAKDVVGTLGGYLPPTSTVYKIRCVALIELAEIEEDPDDLDPYLLEDGSLASVYREEWVVYRAMKDFQALHKHLKTQVAYSESSGSTGSRLVGAATAAFINNVQGRRQRKALIPSLAQANKTGAIGLTKKSIMKRGELLEEYLEYLLSPDHLLVFPEVMLFVGAFYPLPREVKVLFTPNNVIDPMGRLSMIRSVVEKKAHEPKLLPARTEKSNSPQQSTPTSRSSRSVQPIEPKLVEPSEGEDDAVTTENNEDLILSVLNKVDQVPLPLVRNRIVELIRYQFGFENASFLRSRMLAALQTASFVAVTKATDFRKMLYDLHCKQLNSDAVADWIRVVLDLLWPDGVWMTSKPQLTKEEEEELFNTCREKLHEVFPDQIRSILGRELTRDGMNMLHEMLQNRLVVKSLFYMLFDLLWIEIFPELRDVLTCASVLDIE